MVKLTKKILHHVFHVNKHRHIKNGGYHYAFHGLIEAAAVKVQEWRKVGKRAEGDNFPGIGMLGFKMIDESGKALSLPEDKIHDNKTQ